MADAPSHLQGCFSDASQRNNGDDGVARDCFFRHAENHTTGLVLGNGLGATVAHLQQTLGPIIPHARHNYADCVRSNGLGDRAEQHIYAGSMTRDQRPVGYVRAADRAISLHQKMMIPGSDQSTSRKYAIAVRGFFDVDGAILVQTVSASGQLIKPL